MSQDVYARAGIPMPEEPTSDVNAEVEQAKANVEAEVATDWQKRHEEEMDRQLRLEIVKMAVEIGMNRERVIPWSEQVFDYVKNGKTDPNAD